MPKPMQGVGVAAVDSLAVDSTGGGAPDSLTASAVLSDSARRAIDSVAVASLADTSYRAPAASAQTGTPVDMYGRELFKIYSGLAQFSPAERAERLSDRLTTLPQDRAFNPDSLTIVDGNTISTILFHDFVVMSVTAGDAQALAMTRHQAALEYAREIREAVKQVRERSTVQSVVINAGVALVLFVLLMLLLKGMARAYRWLDVRVLRFGRSRFTSVRMGKLELLPANRIVRFGHTLVGLSRLGASLLLVYLFLTTVFGLFPWTQSWSHLLLSYILAPLRYFARTVVEAAPNVLAILVIVVLIRWVIKFSNYVFAQVGEGSLSLPGFYTEFAEPTRKIVKFLLIVLGVLLAYPYTPIAHSEVFQGLTIFFGVLFSLGSSGAVSNIMAGLVLTYTRAFQVGDRIRIGETTGDVLEKSFLVTRLLTPKNEEVSIPNASVLSNQITNFSSIVRGGNSVVLHTTVTIGYDVPWPLVHQLLVEAARRTADVEASPEPFVLQTALGDYNVAYQLNAHTRQPHRMLRIRSDLHRHIQETFAEAEVEILSPAYQADRDGTASTVPKLRGGLTQDGVTGPGR